MKKTIVKINETESWFFEKINKIYKPLATFIKRKMKKTQINNIRNEKESVTTNNKKMQRTIRECYKKMYAKKWVIWGENGQVKFNSHLW